MTLYTPPPAPPRILFHLAHTVRGAAMLGGLLTGLYMAVYAIAAAIARASGVA